MGNFPRYIVESNYPDGSTKIVRCEGLYEAQCAVRNAELAGAETALYTRTFPE